MTVFDQMGHFADTTKNITSILPTIMAPPSITAVARQHQRKQSTVEGHYVINQLCSRGGGEMMIA